MKKIILLITTMLVYCVMANAENAGDDTTKETNQPVTKQTDAKNIVTPYAPGDTCNNCALWQHQVFNKEFKFSTRETLLVFMPIIIYLLFLFLLKAYLYMSGYKLAEALTENEPVEVDKVVITKDAAGNEQTQTIPAKELPKSVSRLIVFIAGFVAITVGVCFTSYYIYVFFRTGCAPNLDSITDILLSLGIGVVPYLINRTSKALSITGK